MNSSSTLPTLITMVLPRIPFFLVCVAGLVFGLSHWNSHRRPALFVLLGSAALLTGFCASVGMNALVMHRAQSGGSHTEFAALLGIIGIAQGLLSAAGYGLLIWAAFVDRARVPQVPRSFVPSPAPKI